MSVRGAIYDEIDGFNGRQEKAGQPLTIDQQLKLIEIKTLLSISVELSNLREAIISVTEDRG
ncbi:hypothetical protein ACH4T9_12750 [Micromonospora sp. NPDC020750]|uniref:hypothetical protein n=1 Tax=unclassified Micromonospora TaxID=2617518 RepID=UPI0037BBAAFA